MLGLEYGPINVENILGRLCQVAYRVEDLQFKIHEDQNALFQVIVLLFIRCGELFIEVVLGLLDYCWHNKLLLEENVFKHKKNTASREGGQTLEQVAQRVSVHGDPTGHNPEPCALLDPAVRRERCT